MRRNRSATSFCSGSTAFRLSSRAFELGDLLAELVQLIRGRRSLRDGDAKRGQLLLTRGHFGLRRHGVKPVEAADEAEPQRDEEAHLAVPR